MPFLARDVDLPKIVWNARVPRDVRKNSSPVVADSFTVKVGDMIDKHRIIIPQPPPIPYELFECPEIVASGNTLEGVNAFLVIAVEVKAFVRFNCGLRDSPKWYVAPSQKLEK
jgi:hypothetical protein